MHGNKPRIGADIVEPCDLVRYGLLGIESVFLLVDSIAVDVRNNVVLVTLITRLLE